MGCSGSKEETPRGNSPRKPWCHLQPTTPSTTKRRLVTGLQDLKHQMDKENYGKDAFSFTKIILKLGTIEKVLRQVKAVFESVDHGNKGHVTRDELKEGLHKAHVDLGEEWEDTNIDECLEHLHGRAEDHDKVGLREFVVMLAVGRVCRPLKRRSTVFAPLHHQQGKANGAAGAGAGGGRSGGRSRDTSLLKKTINENEVRRPSLTVDTPYTAEAMAAAATLEGEEAAAAAAAGREPLNFDDSDDNNSVNAGGSADHDTQAAGLLGSAATIGETSATTGGGGGGDGGAGVIDLEERAAVAAAAAMGGRQGQDHGGPSPTARVGPGGLPTASSWRSLKWAQIPSLKSLDVSVRGMGIARGFSRSGGLAKAGGGRGGGGGGGGGDDVEVSQSVKYVLDLFIAAYFQFDTTGQGYITKSTVEKTLRQGEREPGASGLLDQRRWAEAAWEGDRLSFQEFIYAFAQWLGLLDDDDDDDGASYQHKPKPKSKPAVASAPATATAATVATATAAPAALAAPAAAGTADRNSSGGKSAALAPASEPPAPAVL